MRMRKVAVLVVTFLAVACVLTYVVSTTEGPALEAKRDLRDANASRRAAQQHLTHLPEAASDSMLLAAELALSDAIDEASMAKHVAGLD